MEEGAKPEIVYVKVSDTLVADVGFGTQTVGVPVVLASYLTAAAAAVVNYKDNAVVADDFVDCDVFYES